MIICGFPGTGKSTMADLIERQAAINGTKELFSMGECYCDKFSIVGMLNSLPSAQPEIIRCKECKHLQKWRSEESVKKFGQIYECARNVLDCPKPEDFCSHAERRADG